MSIVTGAGDDGKSSLFGGKRVSKSHPRLHAYGTTDEAQCAIGIVRAIGEENGISVELDSILARIQRDLFIAGSDLAAPEHDVIVPRVTTEMIRAVEEDAKSIESRLPVLANFILPAGSEAATTCFWARAVVRSAEREVARLLEDGQNVSTVLVYLNRLGDLLFLVARMLNHEAGVNEETWAGK